MPAHEGTIHRTHVLICRCGYSTPVTTPRRARDALRRHSCENYQTTPEIPADLPVAVAAVVAAYVAERRTFPAQWLDSTVVTRFANGDHKLRLTALERIAVYTVLRRRGESANHCARLLRLSWSAQARYRRLLETVSEVAA